MSEAPPGSMSGERGLGKWTSLPSYCLVTRSQWISPVDVHVVSFANV